eukprot:1161808-Pelagomonas_calceolata.AAC.8
MIGKKTARDISCDVFRNTHILSQGFKSFAEVLLQRLVSFRERKTVQSISGRVHSGKVTCPERQGPTTQTKRKSKHKSLLQQVGPRHGTYDTAVCSRPCPASSRPVPKP